MSPRTSLAERLRVALLTSAEVIVEAPSSVTDRILDAAERRFAEVGVDRASMSSIAAEAHLSREWLYHHFPNREAVVTAFMHRELRRFVDGLAVRAARGTDIVEALTDTFVYCVEFLREHRIVTLLADRDVRLDSADLRDQAGALVAVAVRTCTGYLVDLGGVEPVTATVIAETLTRLVGSTLVVPRADLDLHDPETLRDYARRVVPAVVRGC